VSDVFISYKSERRAAAEHLAATLTRYGYSVWFDYALVKGRDFGLQIDAKVRAAKTLVVMWCTLSVQSRWVHEEVDLAHELGILTPVKIEACDLPVGNRRVDYVDLIGWDGSPRSHALDDLLDTIAQKVARAPAPDYQALRDYEATWRRFGALPLKAFALARPLETVEAARGIGAAGVAVPLPPATSPTALAWAQIAGSTDPADYADFILYYPGAAELIQASRHKRRLEAWASVDKTDPDAICAFLREANFSALELLARHALSIANSVAAVFGEELPEPQVTIDQPKTLEAQSQRRSAQSKLTKENDSTSEILRLSKEIADVEAQLERLRESWGYKHGDRNADVAEFQLSEKLEWLKKALGQAQSSI
jgi:hypothetical protein